MRSDKSPVKVIILLLVVFGFLNAPSSAFSVDKLKLVHSFGGSGDGATPFAGLISDANGNLYGTTGGGGAYGNGTVFELQIDSSGHWTEKILYSFCPVPYCGDGSTPYASLALDSAGNLFGTTYYGGAGTKCNLFGCGTVFKLAPVSDGKWSESVLYSFLDEGDGAFPVAPLVVDSSGNIYGTMSGYDSNCNHTCGNVFELSPEKTGWRHKVLHFFRGPDGTSPEAGLTFDSAGNLYGTTLGGGANRGGTMFELTRGSNGRWTERVLYSFCGVKECRDGSLPWSNVVFDAAGRLYTMADSGGDNGYGTVFGLKKNRHGNWIGSSLHSFNKTDGAYPFSGNGVIVDSMGNLYGMTNAGGNQSCLPDGCGVVFKLTPTGHGKWSEEVLHSFSGGKDGDLPQSGMIFNVAGKLFGTNTGVANRSGCNEYNCGVVFEITP